LTESTDSETPCQLKHRGVTKSSEYAGKKYFYIQNFRLMNKNGSKLSRVCVPLKGSFQFRRGNNA
jgi:hypothetical protein